MLTFHTNIITGLKMFHQCIMWPYIKGITCIYWNTIGQYSSLRKTHLHSLNDWAKEVLLQWLVSSRVHWQMVGKKCSCVTADFHYQLNWYRWAPWAVGWRLLKAGRLLKLRSALWEFSYCPSVDSSFLINNSHITKKRSVPAVRAHKYPWGT